MISSFPPLGKTTISRIQVTFKEYKTAAVFYRQSAILCQELDHTENMAICLEQLAWLHWQQGVNAQKVVQWLAAAAAWREEVNILLFPFELISHEQRLIEIKKQMSKQAFMKAWQEGSTQSLAEALEAAVL